MTVILVAVGIVLGVGALLYGLGIMADCVMPFLMRTQLHCRPTARFPSNHNRPLPCPTITYLINTPPRDAHLRLERGQVLTVPWPHTLEVLLPRGVRLQILEATSESIRVIAV